MRDLKEILDRCRRGDELAWEALVRHYQSRVYGVALHYVRDPAEARDVAQEIFVRLYQRMDKVQGHETFLPWLLRMARNLCIDYLRRRKARPPSFDVPVEDQESPELPDTRPGPHEAWTTESRKRLVYQALGRVTDQDREIILLKDIQGLNLKEIAEMLEIPIGTAKSRSHRARILLAKTILALNPAYAAGGLA